MHTTAMKLNGVMGFGLPDDAVDAAELAVLAKLDGIWRGGSLSDAIVPLTLAAKHEPNLQVATSIVLAFGHNPLTLAQSVFAAHVTTEGRFVLGLGAQTDALIAARYGTRATRPIARMREYVEVLRRMWRSWIDQEPLVLNGEFYRHDLRDMPLRATAASGLGVPAVHLAAVGPRMTALAGEVADGVMLSGLSSRYVQEVTMPALAAAAAAAGRPADAVESSMSCVVVTGEDDAAVDAARETARGFIGHITGTASYRPLYDLHGWSAQHERLTSTHDLDAVEDEILEELAIIASVEKVGAALVERFGGLVDGLSLCFAQPVAADVLVDIAAQVRHAARATPA